MSRIVHGARVRAGIVDGRAYSIISRVDAREALGELQLLAVRRAAAVHADARLVGEVRRLDHERVAFPVAARVAQVLLECRLECGRPSSGITRVSWTIS